MGSNSHYSNNCNVYDGDCGEHFLPMGEVIFIAGIIGMFMLALMADILIQVTVFKDRKSSRIGRRGNIFKRSGNKKI